MRLAYKLPLEGSWIGLKSRSTRWSSIWLTARSKGRNSDPILSNFEGDAPVARWARGFVDGHLWLEDAWEDFISSEMDEELSSVLMVLSFFSSRSAAEDYRQELTELRTSLAELAGKIRKLFPDAMRSYANLGRSIHEALMTIGDEDQPTGTAPKAGRNDPCPCGSGKKYKRCHGAN